MALLGDELELDWVTDIIRAGAVAAGPYPKLANIIGLGFRSADGVAHCRLGEVMVAGNEGSGAMAHRSMALSDGGDRLAGSSRTGPLSEVVHPGRGVF